MKVLFIADVSLENPNSGSEQVLYQQAKGLACRGMEVCAITRCADSPATIVRNVAGVKEGCYHSSVKDLAHFLSSMLIYPCQFYNSFTHDKPCEIAICHQPFNCLSLLMMRKLQHLPLVYIFHSPSHEEYLLANGKVSFLRNLFQVVTRRRIEQLCLKRTKKIVVLSRYMEKKVHDIHAISSDKTSVNPGGVNLSRFKPPQSRELLKIKLGLPEGKVHLLTIRNLEPRMGIENLLKSICILKRQPGNFHLILGGEGIIKTKLERIIKEQELSDTVTLAGFIPPDLLPQYYGAADFFILPTCKLEGFGLVTVESMACGTPVLGTPVGGTKEILQPFNPESLFEDASSEAIAHGIEKAMDRYFNNQNDYQKLRYDCREYVEKNYSWQRHIDQLIHIISDTCRTNLRIAN
jgi:glycosyltransferase involved in cell wall biosynthesis